MADSLPLPPTGFDDLSVEEKIDYVNCLWDRIALGTEEVPLPDWHRQILDERLARDDAHPEEGFPWEEVKQEILRDLGASAAKR